MPWLILLARAYKCEWIKGRKDNLLYMKTFLSASVIGLVFSFVLLSGMVIAQPACNTGADQEPCDGVVNLTELQGYIQLWYGCSSCYPDLYDAVHAYIYSPVGQECVPECGLDYTCESGTCVFHGSAYYVRAAASGNGSGSDWTNALTGLPALLERDVVYYVASGDYNPGGYTFDDAAQGAEYITVKKATADEHGTENGWQDGYGDEQAIFGDIVFSGASYIIFDGAVENGFKVEKQGLRGATVDVVSGSSHIIISNCEVDAGFETMSGDEVVSHTNGACHGIRLLNSDYLTVENCEIHDGADDGIEMLGVNNVDIIGNEIYNFYGDDSGGCQAHTDGIEIIDGHNVDMISNLVYDMRGNAAFITGDAERAFPPSTNLVLENNIFYAPECGFSAYFWAVDGLKIYNNVIWGRRNGGYGGLSLGRDLTNTEIYNNIILSLNYNHMNTVYNPVEHDINYNLFGISLGQGGFSENSGNNSVGDPDFQNMVISSDPADHPREVIVADFDIQSSSPAIDAGYAGDAQIIIPALDYYGNSRFGDFGPDCGAIEYGGVLACAGTDSNCGVYPGCENCNAKDGCSAVPGGQYLDYYCSSDNCDSYNDITTAESVANGNCADGLDNDCDGDQDGDDADCPDCYISPVSSFRNFGITPAQTSIFTAEFDATPNSASMDSLIGLSSTTGMIYGDYRDYGVIVRFAADGYIDARNGGGYSRDIAIQFVPGTQYHFRVVVDVPSHEYDVYVTEAGGSEQTLATDYAFRNEQNTITNIDNWGIVTYTGSFYICDFVLGGAAPSVCGDGNCDAGEDCPADAVGCTDNVCYESPTCVSGCGQAEVAARQNDVGCGLPSFCDGAGSCVECIDAGDCTGEEQCSGGSCTVPLSGFNITQFGITWYFDEEYQYGTFANDDFWVVPNTPGGNVTIIGIDPMSVEVDNGDGQGPHTKHGTMINPDPADINGWTNHGFDSRLNPVYFVPGLNKARPGGNDISQSNPMVVPAGSSVVSARSRYEDGTWSTSPKTQQLLSVSILTVLDSALDQNNYYFRPAYSEPDKSVNFNVSGLNYSKLGNYPLVGVALPTLSETIAGDADLERETFSYSLERAFKRPWIDFIRAEGGSYSHPQYSTPHDGIAVADFIGRAAVVLNSNEYTDAEKEKLLIRYTQLGIDLYGIADNENGAYVWIEGGQIGAGRKFPILFAGMVLNDNDMINIGSWPLGDPNFAEDSQTFYVSQADININSGRINRDSSPAPPENYYQQRHLGMPEWGIRHGDNVLQDSLQIYTPYRSQIRNWGGFVLGAQMMNVRDYWNHNVLFDYADRWMELTNNQGPQWIRDTWNANRGQIGCMWTRDDPTFCNLTVNCTETWDPNWAISTCNITGPCYSNGHYDCNGIDFRCNGIASSVGIEVDECSDYTNKRACDYDPCNFEPACSWTGSACS